MFRTLGLRHLPVVNKDFELQGIITRRNFLESHGDHHVKQNKFEMATIRMFMPAPLFEEEQEAPAGAPAPATPAPAPHLIAAPMAVEGDIGETMV